MSGAVAIMAASGGLSVRVTPDLVIGFGSGTVTTTQPLVGTITGGTAPFTWNWSLAGDAEIVVVFPDSLSTPFRRPNVDSGFSYEAVATLIVFDSSGQSASASGNIKITGV